MSTHTNDVCGYITPQYNTMIHVVGIYYGTIAISRGLTRITVTAKLKAFHLTIPAIISEIMEQDCQVQ